MCPSLLGLSTVEWTLIAYAARLKQMSFIKDAITHPVPILSSVEPHNLLGKEPMAAAGSDNEKFAQRPLANATRDSDPDVVLVDFKENDPRNPLNWSPMQKWMIVFVISWMGFVRWA
jgi:hypothetical protein